MAAVYRNSATAFRNRIGKPSFGPVTYRLRRGPSLLVDPGPHDVRQINEIWIDKAYALVDSFTPQPGWSVVDVGANKGIFSTWAAHHMKHGTILALEPDERSIGFARANLAQFPTVDIDLRRNAVAATDGTVELFVSEGATGLTSLYGPKAGDGETRVPSGRSITAPCVTLTEILTEQRPDLVKIDVEGSEYDILMSTGVEVLSRVDRIVLEYDLRHPIRPEVTHLDLERHLRIAGFAVQRPPWRRLMFATSKAVIQAAGKR